jgi:osmotically-inducible protein OsmY
MVEQVLVIKEMCMKTDAEIRRDVEAELQWDPSMDDKKIGVIVNNGIVTLTGEVANFAGKWSAEDIAKRVSGVRAIANDIQVKIPLSGMRSDTDIAEAAANALRWNVSLAGTQIKPVVKDGWITLSGNVKWGFQRILAENTVRNLISVKGVTNDVMLVAGVAQLTGDDTAHSCNGRRHGGGIRP